MTKFTRNAVVLTLVAATLLLSLFHQKGDALEDVDFLRMKEGFKASYFAKHLPFGPRAMVLGDKGTLFVGERIPNGTLYAIKFDYKSYEVSQMRVVARGLFNPAAVLFRNQSLYLGATDKIYRWDNIEEELERDGAISAPTVLFTFSETSLSHPVRYITFSPLDTQGSTIYVNIGAPCDECLASDPWDNLYAIDITVKKPKMRLVARGIRTIVGLDWHPVTHDMYFSENGPAPWNGVEDLVNPPDEINILSMDTINSGQIPDYGYPFCYGYNRPSPTYHLGASCWNYTSAYFELGAHVAPLGVKFYTGNNFPEEFKNTLLIAEHAPHVRNGKTYPRPFNLTIGHRVTYLDFSVIDANGKPYYGVLADGWRTNNINPHDEDVIGAPVDFLLLPDGSMLVSDDLNKAIYRFEYVGVGSSNNSNGLSLNPILGMMIGVLIGVIGTLLVFVVVRRIILRRRVEHIGGTSRSLEDDDSKL